MRLIDAEVFEERLMDARAYYIGEKADDFDLRFAAGLMSAAERLVDATTVDAIPKSVLEDIKAEIMAEIISHSGTGEEVLQAYVDGLHKSIEFIDKYISGEKQ